LSNPVPSEFNANKSPIELKKLSFHCISLQNLLRTEGGEGLGEFKKLLNKGMHLIKK
jgi:hypothetical protein